MNEPEGLAGLFQRVTLFGNRIAVCRHGECHVGSRIASSYVRASANSRIIETMMLETFCLQIRHHLQSHSEHQSKVNSGLAAVKQLTMCSAHASRVQRLDTPTRQVLSRMHHAVIPKGVGEQACVVQAKLPSQGGLQ